MTKRKHADVAIRWFNGGQIDTHPEPDAAEDDTGWKLWDKEYPPRFDEYHSYRIHDPYRALKKREKEGAVIQWRYLAHSHDWKDCSGEPTWSPDYEYREKPAESPAKRKIDWSKMPVDTLCEVWGGTGRRYFSGHLDNGEPLFFADGSDSKTQATIPEPSYYGAGQIKIIPQDWRLWFGGECPVPEGVEFDFVRRDGQILTGKKANSWRHLAGFGSDYDIIAFRILGVAEGWEE